MSAHRLRRTRLPLPTTTQLYWAPERAVLCAVDTGLGLAIRALKAAHPMLEDSNEPPDHEPLLTLAQAILVMARALRELLAGYDELAARLTRIESPAPGSRAAARPSGDEPF